MKNLYKIQYNLLSGGCKVRHIAACNDFVATFNGWPKEVDDTPTPIKSVVITFITEYDSIIVIGE